jgi:hypothetical protein
MKEIELLTDLIHLLDKYDPETCASLARELSNPDFMPRLLDLLHILSKRPTAQTIQTARELENKAYLRSQAREHRRSPRAPVEEQVTFAHHFQALKDYQARDIADTDLDPLRDDEQIIK